jgi:hypothetical protein
MVQCNHTALMLPSLRSDTFDHAVTPHPVALGTTEKGGREVMYQPQKLPDVLLRHGGGKVQALWQNYFRDDPCFPHHSSADVPPISRVFHVFGKNLDTEIAATYRHRHAIGTIAGGPAESRLALDRSLKLHDRSFKVKHGLILETPETLQRVPLDPAAAAAAAQAAAGAAAAASGGGVAAPAAAGRAAAAATRAVRASGDGTVPYMSMAHSLSWGGPTLLSQVVELEHVEHRAILAERQFHTALNEYATETLVVYVLSARGLAAKDLLSRSSDPYVTVTVHCADQKHTTQRRTATKARTLCPVFDEALVFCPASEPTSIEVEVRDADAGGLSSEHIGTAERIFFGALTRSRTRALHGWCKLRSHKRVTSRRADGHSLSARAYVESQRSERSRVTGELYLHLELEDAGQSHRGVPQHIELAKRGMMMAATTATIMGQGSGGGGG